MARTGGTGTVCGRGRSAIRMDLQFAIRDEVVLRLAELYGRRPEEIDPDWGM